MTGEAGDPDPLEQAGPDDRSDPRGVPRRTFLVGAAAGAIAGGAAAVALPAIRRRLSLRRADPTAGIPDAPEGVVDVTELNSDARGAVVALYRAVPAGHGNGDGLPVCLVLHGASATVADFERFGFARFLTASVRGGTPPFALIAADGGRQSWEPLGDDDPQAMVLAELPRWATDHGLDGGRVAAWGWSMGGYGVLRAAEVAPGRFRAVAAFSPALRDGDPVMSDVTTLAGTSIGVWCGIDDGFFPVVERFTAALPEPPAIRSFSPGGHTREYWNSRTLEAFDFIGRALTPA